MHWHTPTVTDEQHGGNLSNNSHANIKLVKCGAYEVVQLSKQRVTMKDNPAYGEVGKGVQ